MKQPVLAKHTIRNRIPDQTIQQLNIDVGRRYSHRQKDRHEHKQARSVVTLVLQQYTCNGWEVGAGGAGAAATLGGSGADSVRGDAAAATASASGAIACTA